MEAVEEEEEEEEGRRVVAMGSYRGMVVAVRDAAEEILLLWAFRQPSARPPNAFARQSSLSLKIEACGCNLTVHQSPSSLGRPGVTGAVMWDSGVVLAKFLEHAVDSSSLDLQGKKAVELGSGCGLVGCIAALLGAKVILTDLPDRLKLLRKNVEVNLHHSQIRGSAIVSELTWGDDLYIDLIDPLPDFVFGSDVVYSEAAVNDLLITLRQLSGNHTTIFITGELRNDVVLEYFLEAAMKDFTVGQVEQSQWHPEFQNERIVIFVLVKKTFPV
ncbi:unnamed protein product [Victoria cruziana]